MKPAAQPHNFQSRQKMKFTKTETEYSMKSIRFLLLTITTMFIMTALLMIVLGISEYSRYHSFTSFYDAAKTGRIFTPSVMSVLLGLILLVITSFGFFGSLKLSTCMVNSYAVLLSIIFLTQLVAAVLAFTMQPGSIIKHIDIPVWDYGSDPEITQDIHELQTQLRCCGSSSYLDYLTVDFSNDNNTVFIVKEVEGELLTMEVPDTCCNARPGVLPADGKYYCTKMYNTSCKDALVNLIVQNASVLGVLGVSVMFVQLLGIIFAVLLARCIRKLKSERALLNWKIKEQMILAREAQNRSVFISETDSSIA